MKRRAVLPAFLVLFCLLTACGTQTVAPPVRPAVQSSELQFTAPAAGDPVAVLETGMGRISIRLFETQTPLAVDNFRRLAQKGSYNDTVFHRVQPDFAVQGGDPTGTGLQNDSAFGVPLYAEITGQLYHFSGAVCFAPTGGDPNTLGSQFYILATPADNINDAAADAMRQAGYREEVIDAYRQAGGAPYLDTGDTVFGQVYEGMDIVDRMAAVPTDADGRPVTDIQLLSVTVTTYPPA